MFLFIFLVNFRLKQYNINIHYLARLRMKIELKTMVELRGIYKSESTTMTILNK